MFIAFLHKIDLYNSITSCITGCRKWLAQTVYIQIVLSSFSLPLLLMAGIPIASLTFLGNILFAPLLTAFLLCSLMLFVSELVGLPSSFWALSLNKLGAVWEYLAQNLAFYSTFLELPAPPLSVTFIFLLSLLFCLSYKNFTTRLKRSCALVILTGSFMGSLALWAYVRESCALYTHKNIVIKNFKLENTLIVIDPGTLTTIKQVKKHINERFFRLLRKELGSTALSHIVILKPTAASAALVEALARYARSPLVIYIPKPTGTPPSKTREAYKLLTTWADSYSHKLVFYTAQESCMLTNTLKLVPVAFLERSKAWKHPLCTLEYSTNNNTRRSSAVLDTLKQALDPVITPREQVLPLSPQVPEANTPACTDPL